MTSLQQPHRQRAVHQPAASSDPPGVGADGQEALLRHDVLAAGPRVGVERLPEEPLVRRHAAVAVHAVGVLQHRPALVRRVVRVQAVAGRRRVALDRDGLCLSRASVSTQSNEGPGQEGDGSYTF